MRLYGHEEESRNGKVHSILSPVMLKLLDPTMRVITDPTRDANPFFHVMEFVWMMAGSNDVAWVARFNRNMLKYSDDGFTVHGAYGHRWRRHFGLDQVKKIIGLIKKNPQDRRLVINMWNPDADLGWTGADVPCNTQLLFRVVEEDLQMTVINRSNDLIWGALGANLCHMTMLHELIANAVGIPLGNYYVFTQNLHIYEAVPNFDYYTSGVPYDRDIYREVNHLVPMLAEGETYAEFVEDCEKLVQLGAKFEPRTQWMRHVGMDIYRAWFSRTEKDLDAIIADDWRIACTEWVERRKRPTVDDKLRDYYTGVLGRQQVEGSVVASSEQSMPVVGVDYSQPDVGNAPAESGANDTLPSQPF
jgi:hypothetical protein